MVVSTTVQTLTDPGETTTDTPWTSLHVGNMRRILSISYYDLPPHLKTCLLYLSLYPEDHVILAEDVIWKWIGEGFIHNEQGKSLHEVGEDYLDELINKSLIQPVVINIDNKESTCRVHDMVLDLITSLSNEEHFLTTIGGQQPVTVPTKIRRLSLQTSNEDDVKQLSTMSLSHVRTLTMFKKKAFSLLPALSSFPVLRALDLDGCYQVENHHCKDICNLFHLRYLNLSGTSISEIPKEIGKLQSLQVLDISVTEIEELPSTSIQLRQLVRLRVDRSTRLPDGFGNLKCLQELLRIRIRSPTMLHDLGGLTKLRHLDIMFNEWDKRYEEPFLQCLSNLVSLEILVMFNCCGGLGSRCENLSPGPQLLRSINIWHRAIHTVPRWMSSLSSLSYLHIKLETLGVEDLQVLGGIPSLGDLHIEVEHPTKGRDERLIIGSGYPFRCLRKLVFWSVAMEMEVVFAQGAMQKLQTLEFGFQVRKAMDFDFGLENLSSLKHTSVEIWGCFGAEPWEVEAAEAAIRRALDMNPNNPTLELEMLTMFEEEAFSLLPALSSFPVLRALDLRGCDLVENRHCKDICNLFHLRYLNLSWTSIREIPKEIGNLLYLQVLDISETEIEELPSTFVQLRQLVCLRVGWSTRLPDGIENLKCLQELPFINIGSPTMRGPLC